MWQNDGEHTTSRTGSIQPLQFIQLADRGTRAQPAKWLVRPWIKPQSAAATH
uniref:Uncharacterized protein MANES_14G162000 n=1 Tax=Rhizophora mucronata TaxID=61149 RepID=A0A2P2MNG0_RHIMU